MQNITITVHIPYNVPFPCKGFLLFKYVVFQQSISLKKIMNLGWIGHLAMQFQDLY